MKELVKKPLISEKNSALLQNGTYAFEVDQNLSKPEIKAAIEKGFGVKVRSVRTMISRGRAKNNKFGAGRIPRWKKALVTLKAGEKISMLEGV